MHGIYIAHARFDDLEARSVTVGRQRKKNQRLIIPATKQAISIVTTIAPPPPQSFYMTLTKCIWLDHLGVFVFKVVSEFDNFNLDEIRVCEWECVCLSLASDSSETIEGILIKLGTVTASDMRMHPVNYIDLDLHSRSQILGMKIINVWLFHKLFKQCTLSLLRR